MADSVDRVFVHALNTVKKIPRTGSARPPPADRLRLYGLYKQAMEGDVDGVMDRPGASGYAKDHDAEIVREQEKWDAWDAQKGVSRTEAKRRYIEALIETMHKYASTTADARELVTELEFVWDQIKHNSSGSSSASPGRDKSSLPKARKFARPRSGGDGPMKVLSPMSQDDEAEGQHETEDDEYEEAEGRQTLEQDRRKDEKWRRKLEAAMVKVTAEMAALREQVATGREWRVRKSRTVGAWLFWGLWLAIRHLLVDLFVWGLILLWMRKKKDRRIEDLVREGLKIGREYARRLLPAR
ncbi:MAG: hypothetical protein M1818_003979 [Claussenomyces sp. TS43310]|nr:MAG: hypothetical protein M1818_003979 [Claussenomyces sp. TS43310]